MAAKMLTAQELRSVSDSPWDLLDSAAGRQLIAELPEPARQALNAERRMRDAVRAVNYDCRQMERIAMTPTAIAGKSRREGALRPGARTLRPLRVLPRTRRPDALRTRRVRDRRSGEQRTLPRGHRCGAPRRYRERLDWIVQQPERQRDALRHAIVVIDSLPTTSTAEPSYGPWDDVAVPARSGSQRLGVSAR